MEPVKKADPASFEKLDGPWFKDKQQAYYIDSTAPLPELAVVKVDMASFEVLGGAYARDAKGLIVEGVRKRGIDNPAAVESLGYSFAWMGDTLLYRGKPIGRLGKVNPATARGVHEQLLIDANGEMLVGGSYRKKIPGIDPASLHFLNRVFAVDARHVYAITDTALLRIEDIESDEVEPTDLYSVRVGGTQFHVSGGIVRRLRPEDTSG
ncbi:DKNYY domain-containing protein [Agrobacterium pusense]|uniref:DKNYY domain-containing protein n=1 Tax=Agrobacterium pusense TaxID=648995 RepID=UPI001CB78173|nr:DKNYY domain-containing protein [Agrobacterium pusense]